ncbi:MAG: hypothetical protein NVS2B14_04940 [Chamaesiphon sp.]
MPLTPHTERHFTASEMIRDIVIGMSDGLSEMIRDIVIGMSDGLSVPFALLEAPNPSRASQSALTIAISYIAGGLVPLAPYIVFNNSLVALRVSIIATLGALYGFGYLNLLNQAIKRH